MKENKIDNQTETNNNIKLEKPNEEKKENNTEENKIESNPIKEEQNKNEIKKEEGKKEENNKEKEETKNVDEYEDWADASLDDDSSEEEEELNRPNDNEKSVKENENNEVNNTNKDDQPANEKLKEEINQLVKAISLNNYHETKNKLKTLLNNNANNQEYFIECIYKYSLEQLSYQKIYSNLFKDIYLYLSLNKNELKFFRKKLIEKCKQNLIKKKNM